MRWSVACLALAGCSNPAKQRYEASVDCAANEFPRHDLIDQQTDPAKGFFAEDRKIWAILTADAARDGRPLDIPAERVQQEITERGRIMRRDYRVEFADVAQAATSVYEKAHQCLRHSSGGAAAEALLTIKPES